MTKYRTFNGSENNVANPTWGAVGTQLLRVAASNYADGISTLAVRGANNPNPRIVSNKVCLQGANNPNGNGLSDFIWAWGQFLDHELDLTETTDDPANFNAPANDPQPKAANATVGFMRSEFDESTGMDAANPRQQINQISTYIDGSNVYGSSDLRSAVLRAFDGKGRLKTSDGPTGDMLPYNIAGLDNADNGGPASALYLGGDIRANEHAVLTSMHTLFVREHNRLCIEILAQKPDLAGDDETVYQLARKIVGGLMQWITYDEFLPTLLGPNAIPAYNGYDDTVNPGITNVFSTAVYRFGHSMLSSTLQLGTSGNTVALRDAFFNPNLVMFNGIEPFLRGLATQVMQRIDTEVVEDIRSFLFGPPSHMGLLDLAALNIQRGRDHGLPDYNSCRQAFGLVGKVDFADITQDVVLQTKLEDLYGDVNSIDPWVGGLAEDHLAGANMGEFIRTVLIDQFTRLRDGDRFWFEGDDELTAVHKDQIRATRLSDIVKRNSNITDIQDGVFIAQ